MVPEVLPVRPATAGDVVQIRALATGNGMFAPDEMSGFDGMLSGYLDGSLEGHEWVVVESSTGLLVGAAYIAPEPFGDRVWNLYFIAVHPDHHRTGTGSALLSSVERTLRSRGAEIARVLIVETSSSAAFEEARSFYVSRGFAREAVIREFYGPGDDKVVFWKSLVDHDTLR